MNKNKFFSKIEVMSGGKRSVTNLDNWLKGKNIKFDEAPHAEFNDCMLSTVEFDKDNSIYIILPKDVFKEI